MPTTALALPDDVLAAHMLPRLTLRDWCAVRATCAAWCDAHAACAPALADAYARRVLRDAAFWADAQSRQRDATRDLGCAHRELVRVDHFVRTYGWTSATFRAWWAASAVI